MSNKALNKTNKQIASGDLSSDEHYTKYIDITTELFYYKDLLKGADILCPCDSKDSNFVKFFESSKDLYQIRSFQYFDFNPETNEGTRFQDSIPTFAKEHPNGIVVTNPPFSCIREFIEILEENKLKYIFIAPMTFAPYRTNGLPFILNNTMWCGHNQPKTFVLPDGTEKEFGNICWFTNLKYKDCFNTIYLTYHMEHHDYKYSKSHKDVLWVENCDEIPIDYYGLMRVPMSYLIKHNPSQFEILYGGNNTMIDKNDTKLGNVKFETPDGKTPFLSFIIKRVQGAII
jgi:hypothetical protein